MAAARGAQGRGQVGGEFTALGGLEIRDGDTDERGGAEPVRFAGPQQPAEFLEAAEGGVLLGDRYQDIESRAAGGGHTVCGERREEGFLRSL